MLNKVINVEVFGFGDEDCYNALIKKQVDDTARNSQALPWRES